MANSVAHFEVFAALPARLCRVGIALLTMCLGPFASAQPAATAVSPRSFSITRSDPSLDALIAPDAKLKTIAAGFGFIDTPVWIAGRDDVEGYLLASSIIDNGPNDVAIAADGAIYFTDSDVGIRGGIKGPLAQMPDSVWRWKDGKVTLTVSREQLGAEPNGIALSPDDKYLYLSAGTVSPDPRIIRYPVNADGSVGAGELFTRGAGIGDGMKTDRAGNLWSTDAIPGTVRITSPTGRL